MPNLVAQVKRAINDSDTALVADLYDDKFCTPAETVSLLHFDDPDNPLRDECGNSWHIDGAPYINTSNAKFGNSIHINSVCRILSDYIVDFQGQPMTFIWWGYYTNPTKWSGNTPTAFALADNDGDVAAGKPYDRISLTAQGSSSAYRFVSHQKGNLNSSPSATTYPMNAWHHSAVIYSNGVWRLFINGILKFSYSFNLAFKKYQINLAANYSDAWGVFSTDVAGGCRFRGYFDEFRFVDGKTLWTSNFTPPTQPYKLVDGHIPCRLQGSTQRLWAPFNFIKTDLTQADSDTT